MSTIRKFDQDKAKAKETKMHLITCSQKRKITPVHYYTEMGSSSQRYRTFTRIWWIAIKKRVILNSKEQHDNDSRVNSNKHKNAILHDGTAI